MRILMLAENDPAGTAIRFAAAIHQFSDHVCRVVTCQTRYTHAWEKDLHVPDLDAAGLDELEHLLKTSDVYHFHMIVDEQYAFGPFLPKDHMAGKLVVHHHHGHHDFRAYPEKYREKYRRLGRTRLLVSTPDLLHKLPEARWQPNLVPLDAPGYAPTPWPACPPLRLAHAPTRKDLKNTDALLRVLQRLQGRGLPLELDLLDDIPHARCLARKQACHLCFDHMQGYYGMSSLESLAQGRAVIAGLDDWNQRVIRETLGCGDLPWLLAHDEAGLERLLADLAADPHRCRAAGEAGRRFMETVWNPERLTAMLLSIYQ